MILKDRDKLLFILDQVGSYETKAIRMMILNDSWITSDYVDYKLSS
jgi:hypothetical protein